MAGSEQAALAKLAETNLRAESDLIIRAVANPKFIERVNAVLSAPPAKQFGLASKTLSPKALVEAGIRVPEGVRVSSRYFEEPGGKAREIGSIGRPRIRPGQGPLIPTSGTAGWSVCVCVGVAACVGVGGGS